MKYSYAFRIFSEYPYLGNAFDMDPEKITTKFLKRVKDMGFDGIELGMECLEKIDGGEKGVKESVMKKSEDKKINFFHLGPKNNYKELLNKELILEMNSIYKDELKEFVISWMH